MTTFHTDLPKQLETFAAVKNRCVRAPFPAWTAIDVDRLLPDNGLVEIKVVGAALGEGRIGAAGAAVMRGRAPTSR